MTGDKSNFTNADKLPNLSPADEAKASCLLVHPLAHSQKSNTGKTMWYVCNKCGARAMSWQKLREQYCRK